MNQYDVEIMRLAGQGFCCSQIVMHLALDLQGSENPGLIRALNGLCHGFGSERGACGALLGAVCLLGYHAGKGTAEQAVDERLPLMRSELAAWFEQEASSRFGGITCNHIAPEVKPRPGVCGTLVAECLSQALTLLLNYGFEPTIPADL